MYGFGFYRFDGTYILVLIGVVLSMLASSKVKSTFNKYSRVRSMAGITGAEAAERILRQSGIYDVRIEHISGNLTDHYDPSSKVLRLSDSVYGSTSVAAIGVAAHECGHAVQHQVDRLRFLNRIGQHRPRIAILAIFIRIAIHIDVAVKCIVGGQVLILGYGSARQILKYHSLELNDICFFIRGIGKGRSRQQAEQEC